MASSFHIKILKKSNSWKKYHIQKDLTKIQIILSDPDVVNLVPLESTSSQHNLLLISNSLLDKFKS